MSAAEENIKVVVFSDNLQLSQLTREEQYALYHDIWSKNKTIPFIYFDLHLEAELEIEADVTESTVPASIINDFVLSSAYHVVLLEATKEGGRFVSFLTKTPKATIAKNAILTTLNQRTSIMRQGLQMTEAPGTSIQVSGIDIIGPQWTLGTQSVVRRAEQRVFMFKDEKEAQDLLSQLASELRIFNWFKLRNSRYLSAIIPRVMTTSAYNIQQEPLIIAEQYNQIAELLKCRISANYKSALVADLIGRNIDVSDEDHINIIKRSIAMRTLAKQVYQHDIDNHVQSVVMYHMILSKFGAKYVKKWIVGGRTLKQRMDSMNDKDRKLIEKEYVSQKNYLEAIVANKCEHIAIYRALRMSKYLQQTRQLLDQLKPYISQQSSKNLMLPCLKCNLPLICPHYMLIVELEQARADYKIIKHKLTPFQERVQGTSYCHICGEVISYDAEEETHQILDADLSDFIMKECSFIIRRVQFPITTNIYSTMKRITEVIYIYIHEVEKRLLKSKVTIEIEVRNKKRIYVAVYIYAALIHIMLKDDKVRFRDPGKGNVEGRRKDTPPNKLELFKFAISDILSVYNSTIRIIPLFTAEHVKTLFVSAFNVIGSTDMTVTERSYDNTAALIVNNVIYKYFAFFARPKVTAVDLLGRTALSPGYTGDLFADVSLPAGGKWPSPKNRFTLYPELPLMQDAVILFAKMLHDRSYATYIWNSNDIVDKERGVVEFMATLSPAYETYMRAYTTHMIEESKWILHRKSYYSKNFSQLQIKNIRTYPVVMQPMVLSRLFDMEGRPHIWINSKCNVCGNTLAEAMSVKEEVIAAAIERKRELDNFYTYYKTRCPVYGAHEGVPCVKCGFTGDRNDAYHNKYASAYAQRFGSSPIIVVTNPPTPTAQPTYKYTSNFAFVVDLAAALKINKHVIESLGSTERVQYDKILNGEYVIPAVIEINDVRLHKIIAHIMYLLREYTMLCNYYHGQTTSITDFFAGLKESRGISIDKYSMRELAPKLPDIYDNFNDQLAYFYNNETPSNIHTWLIHTFCEKCLKIYNDKEPLTVVIRKEFIHHVCKTIFKFDELLSVKGWFNMTIIYGEKDNESKEKIEIREEANVDVLEDVFTLDGYDVEVDDEGETEIKVAESVE